ncbi:alkaline shock response membrane anchor protein AmaP [Brevibacillus sp. SYP-B805]|uniref:alkaline shock response membrane anchor protein AmaP n=1 Tax=Brevibacillus sp. SYP-B805 TaxID=1578199 RepID=UPI0013EE0692|nr:alkaline shock response membrane anchor protein AmaP [Brevibacillus sp. SYP-B805]NGQ94709.1 alkaline shock response membrane anchor protein AmaP [Brevibacillus sp. SYP-B805]
MNLFDRFILTLYSFALIVLSVVWIGVAANMVPLEYGQMILQNLYADGRPNIPYLLVGLIFLIISLRFFFSAFSFKKKKAEKGIRQRSEIGEILITLNTIQTIAERAARRVKGVRELKTAVKALESGNLIQLRVSVDGETPLPEMTQKLQHEVKAQVEAIAGVDIAEVTVVVTEVAQHENASLRTRRVE